MHLDRILFQKTLACQISKPLARGDEGHVFYPGKSLALAFEILTDRTHCEASRVAAKLRAVRTMTLPLLALYHGKGRAMTSKCPAVVQRPFHLHFWMLFDPIKQHLHIDVVAVQIVQPQQVWFIFLSPLQKFFGRTLGTKAMGIEQPRLDRMHLAVKICANTNGVFLEPFWYRAFAAIGDFDLVAFGFQLLSKVCANTACTANAANRINKKDFHTLHHLFYRITVCRNALISCKIVTPQFRILARLAVIP